MNFFLINFLIIFCFVGAYGNVFAEELPQTEEGFLEWVRERFGDVQVGDEIVQSANYIRGRVIDQNGTPIPDVEIKAGWFYRSILTLQGGTREKTVFTDNDGYFFIKTTTENSPSINSISKKGYEYNYEDNPFFEIGGVERDERLLDSENNPIIFYLRKRGDTTYIYRFAYNWYVSEPFKMISYDAVGKRIREIDSDLSKLRGPESIDLILSSTHDTTTGTYDVHLSTPLQKNGLQVSDSKLYEAPADGYDRELKLSFKHGEEGTKYIYFTSRKPTVYSRMELTYDALPEELSFEFSTWTNPYGARNLEHEPDMPWPLERQLKEEAVKALENGELPPEPNIPALLATGNYD
ncbi:MAG: carboxypeptidase-like regulatory domain-containing protein [Desulfobulbaceae bacterium]|nr:carboxypeptidase-like regulatory domain-containing protein [Desulfobulbaceae bacterium]